MIIASATSLLAWVQASITLLYRSPKVIWPVLYARWNRLTRASASVSSSAFSAGISRSSMPMRHAAHGGEAEAEVLEPVEEGDRVGQPRPAVALQHQLREVLLLHQVVAEAELGHHPPRQDAVEQHPAHRGPEPARPSRLVVDRLGGGMYQKQMAVW